MKKGFKTVVATLLAVVLLVGGASFAKERIAEKNSIGKENAIKFALADAGFEKDEVVMLRTDFEKENGEYIFEVDFKKDGVEYEYDILASNGAVVKREIDKDDQVIGQKEQETKKETVEETKKETVKEIQAETQGVSLEQAKEIALKDAGVSASDAVFTKAKEDNDDGVKVYDIEFNVADKEYDYEVRISDGAIVKKDVDNEDSNYGQETQAEENYIGVEEAKKIALEHAGLSSAKFSKAKLESDDGRMIYELEFHQGNKEYEYDIDAKTGKILDWDHDLED